MASLSINIEKGTRNLITVFSKQSADPQTMPIIWLQLSKSAVQMGLSSFEMISSKSRRCGRADDSNMNKVLNLTLHNAQVDFYGFLKYSDDIDYWINNTWHIPALQDQAIGLSFIGNDFVLDGHGTGGLDGNGQVWYEYAEDMGNVDGRYVHRVAGS